VRLALKAKQEEEKSEKKTNETKTVVFVSLLLSTIKTKR